LCVLPELWDITSSCATAYLDDTITNIVPADPVPDWCERFDGKDPCTLRGTDMGVEDDQLRLGLRLKDLNRLAERVQKHRHTHTCYKYYKTGEERKCRFNLSEDNFRAESAVDTDTGGVSLRCLDGLVNNFNMTMLEAVRCNMDIQFIGSGESAKAMIYYVTDYITKSQLKSHVAYAALQQAVKRCEAVSDTDDDFTTKSKRLLQKCAYALVSHQEVSAQQVASYLMDYEDHFTSHTFGNLYWPSFERFFDREAPLRSPRVEEATCEERDEEVSCIESEDDEDANEDGNNKSSDTGDEEEVTISINEKGDVKALADQVSDYTLRPEEFSDWCLWDFVAKTEKCRRVKKAQTVENKATVQDEDDEAESTDVEFDVSTAGQSIEDKPRRGRKPTTKHLFLTEHNEYSQKLLKIRSRDIVPVMIGPPIPRRDDPEKYERYCRLMLMLFKPWRQAGDLQKSVSSWENAYEEMEATATAKHLKIINNMQVLHECCDSRDDHMQTRTRPRGRPGMSSDGTGAGNELEDIDMTEVLDHLSEIDRMSSKRMDVMERETRQCLDELERAGWYSSTCVLGEPHNADNCVNGNGLNLPEEMNLEDEWRDFYERRKLAWKLEAKQTENIEEISGTVRISQMQDIEMDENVVNEIGSAVDPPVDVMGAVVAMEQVIDKWMLNTEQKRAFEIVAHHTQKEKPDQLLMFLSGPGGTGKSRVVNALRDFFEFRKECRRFRLAAFTGVAAKNIGGSTLHALLHLGESAKRLSAKSKKELTSMWDGVDYLFIDEVSMIGCELLYKISSAMTEAKGNTCAFGGVNIIFAGDFAQLPPIGDVRLYKDMDTSKANSGATNRAQAKVLGKLLWLSVETVVVLQVPMRQTGSENAPFVDLLGRLRNGVCTSADYDLLKSRTLHVSKLQPNEEWLSAPIIVANNATRDALNVKATEAFAQRTGRAMHWYHARDTHKKALITDPELVETLESQHSGQTKHWLRRIPLVMGMPVSINQNFDVKAGVVNGSWGYLRHVRHSTDSEGKRHLNSCVVEISGCDTVEVNHLPNGHFPVLPDVTELRFEHAASHKRCVIKRNQVPIEPGFAITAHKAQGQTMKNVIVDLDGCSGTEQPYVMVSRSTSLDGLLILRDFDFSRIKKRQSEDLRKEFARLEILRLRTIVEYGKGVEVTKAEIQIRMLQGGVVKANKRGIQGKVDELGKRRKILNT
jgi:hypothetical protein